jgi:hypothetical protein
MELGRSAAAWLAASTAALAASPALAAGTATPTDLPGTVIGTASAASVLDTFETTIYGGPINPPFEIGDTVQVVRTDRPFLAIRSYISPAGGGKAGQAGGWLMPIAEMRGLTRGQILDRWALPIYADGTRNNMLTLALVPQGTTMWSGIAGPIRQSIDGTGDWGAGGGVQYYAGWGAVGISRYQLALTDYLLGAPIGEGPALALGPRLGGQTAVLGGYLDRAQVRAYSDLDTVLTSLDVVSLANPADSAPLSAAVGQLSPERYGALNVLAERRRGAWFDAAAGPTDQPEGRPVLWGRAAGDWLRQDPGADTTGLAADSWSLAFGLDARASGRLSWGVAAGYASSALHFSDPGASRGGDQAMTLGAHAAYDAGRLVLAAQAMAAYSWAELDRRILIADTGLLPRGFSTAIDRTAVGRPHAIDLALRIEAGARLGAIRPFAGLEADAFTRRGFIETGADAADLAVRGQTYRDLRARLGAQVQTALPGGWALDGRLAWSQRLAGTREAVSAALVGQAGDFTVTAGRVPHGLAEARVGVVRRIAGGRLRLGWQGGFGDGYRASAATAEAALRF